jgi:hypothetical protein
LSHLWGSGQCFAGSDGSQDVDSRDDGPEVTRRPTDIDDDAVRREAQDRAPTLEYLLTDVAAKADLMLDPLLCQICSMRVVNAEQVQSSLTCIARSRDPRRLRTASVVETHERPISTLQPPFVRLAHAPPFPTP